MDAWIDNNNNVHRAGSLGVILLDKWDAAVGRAFRLDTTYVTVDHKIGKHVY